MAKHRIVVLDGYTLSAAEPGQTPTNGEPGWQPIEACGQLTVHARMAVKQIPELVGDADIVLTNKTMLDAATMDALPKLRYIGVLATGTNVVDLDAARQRNITVTNVPGYSGASVAQHVFALLLELTNHVGLHSAAVQEGAWSRCPDFSFTLAPMTELADKALGIVGLGDIGQRVARIGHALGMRILAYSRSRKEIDVPVEWMDVDPLFEASDVVTLHCPLTEQTRELVNANRLKRMKSSAHLINTGRGPLIDEAALAEALQTGQIAGAGLDVLTEEPPASGSALFGAPNCVVTPHNAWATRESRSRLMQRVAENIQAFLDGKAINVVNP